MAHDLTGIGFWAGGEGGGGRGRGGGLHDLNSKLS